MKLAESAETYYPDIAGVTTVESLFVTLIRILLETQKDKDINPTKTILVSELDIDEVEENISVSIVNIYGRYLDSGFKAIEPFVNSFSPGLKPWPFNATGLVQAIVDLMFYLHDLELESDESPGIGFGIENGDSENIILLMADAEFELKLFTPPGLGGNTAQEYLLVDQSV